jgi:hypothetical protein
LLKLDSLQATREALEQLLVIMGSATKRVRTPAGLVEMPDWSTRLKACRLVFAACLATTPELGGQAGRALADRRTLRIAP